MGAQTGLIPKKIDNQIIVKKASDLQNIDSTKVYLIDGKIDMGTQQIEVPASGFFYRGLDYFVSCLFSTANNYTMFVNKAGENAGNVRGFNVEHYVSGTGSQLLNLDNQGNFGSIEFISCNFGSFAATTTSLGNIDNYRQFRTNDFAFINILDGIEFNGTWAGGLSVTDTICLSIPAGCTVFKEGTGLSFGGSVVSNINALSVDASSTLFDFQASNFLLDWGFTLENARFSIANNPVPNIPIQSTKRYFKNCRGINNSFLGGGWDLTTQTITSLTVNTLTKLNGTTTYDNLIHFSGLNNNEFTYNSTVRSEFIVSGSLVIDGGPNDFLNLVVRKWDNSASSYIDVQSITRRVSNIVGGNDVAFFNVEAAVELDIDDRIELWVQNITDDTDCTLQIGSYLRVTER